ncbi:D-alanyl-D-alanine carboxypeptidase [Nocardia sp. NPDC046763]|uniref:D-alanyl-D-alanine carboxypeptidase n=1 Tax=Nocardia sp. NPDC046763 TaxID=3155256 RepID=UPI0033D6D87D
MPLDASAAPTNSGRPAGSPAALAEQMQSAIQDASPGTEVGIEVVDATTGAVIADLNADQQFYTASVVKPETGSWAAAFEYFRNMFQFRR